MVRAALAMALLCFPTAQSGALAAAPATKQVEIKRDGYGVPHIFAATTYGLFYGFGYALAEDQLYQMEILKRTGEGRLAEVLGAGFADKDIAARTRIDRASLAAQYARLAPDDQDIFRGMADGMTARIDEVLADRSALLAKDFGDAKFLPEAWGPIDVIAVYEHSMALRFSDLNSELDNLALLSRLRRTRDGAAAWRLFEQLRWETDDAAPTTIAAADQPKAPITTFAAPGPAGELPNRLRPLSDDLLYGPAGKLAGRLTPENFPHASNAWLAGPARTTAGQTVLVNGPQMGDYASAYIWEVGLHGAGFDLVGSGPAGSPFLIFGTNGDIAWGGTAGLGDTVDIYQERLDPRDPHRYLFRGKSLPMTARTEVIRIASGAPRTIIVYATRHGIVSLFDTANGVAYSGRRSWDGSEVESLVGWVHAMKAHGYPEWRRQVARVSIGINNYYADRWGNIGYQFLGRFPIRPRDQDFRLPANGDGSMEWLGFHSTLTNPHLLNPASGLIANWNNKPQPAYHNTDFMYWSTVDRLREIDDQLAAPARLSVDDLWGAIRGTSYTDVTARYLQTLLRTYRGAWPAGSKADQAAGILIAWNGHTANPDTARAEPGYLLHRAVMAQLLEALFAPIMPAAGPGRAPAEHAFLTFDPIFPAMGVKIAYAALAGGHDNAVLDGRRPADILGDALASGLNQARARFGADPSHWTEAAAPHLFSVNNYAGVPQTTDTAPISLPVRMNRGTENDRIVFSHGRAEYCAVMPPGESGFIAPDGQRGPHHDDQLALYRDFRCKPGWITSQEADRHAVSVKTLTLRGPAGSSRQAAPIDKGESPTKRQ